MKFDWNQFEVGDIVIVPMLNEDETEPSNCVITSKSDIYFDIVNSSGGKSYIHIVDLHTIIKHIPMNDRLSNILDELKLI